MVEIAAIGLAYAVMSIVCFVTYALDKRASARRGARRTRESTLLLLGLACGWPGALLAQHWLRHKSAKVSFLWKSRVAVVANLALLMGLAYALR